MNITCTKCLESKDESQFYRNKRYASGYLTWCKLCHTNYYRQPEQRAKVNALNKAWTIKNKERSQKSQAEWYQKNKERISERRREYDRNRWNTDLEYRKKKNTQKKESILSKIQSDPIFAEKIRIQKLMRRQKRRSAEAGLPHTLTLKQWHELLFEYDYSCAYCGRHQNSLKDVLEQEHKIPVTRGGGYTKENIIPACQPCNSHKNNKTDSEFREWIKAHPNYLD